jgi:hypothetical protein
MQGVNLKLPSPNDPKAMLLKCPAQRNGPVAICDYHYRRK